MSKGEKPMTVCQTPAGTWAVVDTEHRALAEFATSAAAWRWFDRRDQQAIADDNRRRQIAGAFTAKASAP